MIFRDHWQGEFSAALIGAWGWCIISFFAPGDSLDQPQFRVMEQIFSENAWQAWLFCFGLLQILGLRHHHSWFRVIGATGILIAFVFIFVGIIANDPWTKGLSLYAVVIFIELTAIIYQTASLVRFGGHPNWRWITQR